jgi:hypothetical protein
MGGIGSGGRRVGSGQKGKKAVVVRHPSAPPTPPGPPSDTFDPPTTLRGKARAVWLELAPQAFEKRTLTRATELSFVILCRNVALERKMATRKYGAGNANHRGIIQRVDAELAHFCLAPFGKPLSEEKPAAVVSSKWAGLLK